MVLKIIREKRESRKTSPLRARNKSQQPQQQGVNKMVLEKRESRFCRQNRT